MEYELPQTLTDRFGRQVDYLRLSVTDRCDFRCVYCMAEDMTFAPKQQVLTLEELQEVAGAFVELGVRKIRLTGGEPLVRNNILSLVEPLGKLKGLEQLALTTNGSQLHRLAEPLFSMGVSRINVSLDSLEPRKFRQLTRHGNLDQVIAGIDSAIDAGFSRIRLNAVILKGRNEDEVLDLVNFALQRGIDIAFIEEMPLGRIDEHDRALSFLSSEALRQIINRQHTLEAASEQRDAGGPARYYKTGSSPSRIGFISPHSHNFCHLCNRVRVTAEGRLLLCLGNEHSVDLRAVLRSGDYSRQLLKRTIVESLDIKPEKHYFNLNEPPQIVRFMNATGG